MTDSPLRYALITPAWNEEHHLPALIASVAAQTIRPLRWVIVSDGSTDGTDAIVTAASERYPWITLLRRERPEGRHFAGKALAVNAGVASLANVDFDLIGNLDADITLPPDYYEFLIGRFMAMPDLGVAGTPFIEDPEKPDLHSYAHGFADLNHVSGACQFFRRRCFEEIGGYAPVKAGGIDWMAVTTARMRGWAHADVPRTPLLSTIGRWAQPIGACCAPAFITAARTIWSVGHPIWQLLRGGVPDDEASTRSWAEPA